MPAQREAAREYARRSGQVISREYIEPGCSGTDLSRKAFRQMLEDVLKPGSDIGTIVVHHTSRFTRNATQARVVKEQLRKQGVKVLSVCQELNDDPIGQLIEGIFECIDQYESQSPSARIWITSSRGVDGAGMGNWIIVHLLGPGKRAGHGDHTAVLGRGRQGVARFVRWASGSLPIEFGR